MYSNKRILRVYNLLLFGSKLSFIEIRDSRHMTRQPRRKRQIFVEYDGAVAIFYENVYLALTSIH